MITFVTLSKNNENTIKKTFESTKEVAPHILVDTGSTDATLEIAAHYPHVTVFKHPFTTYGEMRNLGAFYANTDWIFALDSDEELTPDLQKELTNISLESGTAYRVSSKNFYRGKEIKYSGWSPDYKFRLYNRNETSFTNRKVHENLNLTQLSTKTLAAPLLHYSYDSVHDLLNKMDRYSTLFAEEFVGKKKSSYGKAALKGVWTFWKTYILKRGFLDGKEGLLIAKYNAQTAFYKYIKLMEYNERL